MIPGPGGQAGPGLAGPRRSGTGLAPQASMNLNLTRKCQCAAGAGHCQCAPARAGRVRGDPVTVGVTDRDATPRAEKRGIFLQGRQNFAQNMVAPLIRFSELQIRIPARGSGPDWFR